MEIRFTLDAVIDAEFIARFERLVAAGATQANAFRAVLAQMLKEAERNGVRLALGSLPAPVNSAVWQASPQPVEQSSPLDVDFSDIEI